VTEFGTVRRDGAFGAVRFERVYAVPPEELWAAWTVPERLSRWLGGTLSAPPEPGATLTLAWGDDPDSQVGLVVREMVPPRLLEWEWTINGEPPSLLRVELSPDPGGTRLLLDHSGLPPAQFAGLSAGWHDFLDALALLDVLAGGGPPAEDRRRELLPAYRERVAAL
jgi:uncharacterized protein YndB with AHSA1/START domain